MSTRTNTLLVAVAASLSAGGAVFAQPDPAAMLVEQIAELRAEAGPAAAGLIERLHLLGLLYQESEDHALASAALEEARYLTRVHQGLSSVDEALLLRQQIRSEEALGNHERAWNLEQDMVTIARKHLDNIRTMPIFRHLAEDRSGVLRKVRAGEYPPEMYLGCYYAGPRPRYDDARGERYSAADERCRFGTRDGVILKLRDEILMYYAEAIDVILKNGDYASPELRDLEKRALRVGFRVPYLVLPSIGNALPTDARFAGIDARCPAETLDELLASELTGGCLEPIFRAEGQVIANVGSWVSLVRLIGYEIRTAASAADRANAFVELADWHLLSAPADRRHFEASTHRALELYERAYREIQQSDDVLASIFSPQIPVILPTSDSNLFGSVATAQSSRYIDVAFGVTKFGRGDRIEILAASEDATRADERGLIRLIERTTFRPRFLDGELADSAPVAVRYHLGPAGQQ